MTVLRDVALCVVGIALITVVVDAALRTFVLPAGFRRAAHPRRSPW